MRSSSSGSSGQSFSQASAGEMLLLRAFAKLDCKAMGIAIGLWAALSLSAMTVLLVIDGGPFPGLHLELLSQFFVGYTVTLTGSIIGFGYGFITGFCAGWLIAFLRNLYISAYIRVIKLKSAMVTLNDS